MAEGTERATKSNLRRGVSWQVARVDRTSLCPSLPDSPATAECPVDLGRIRTPTSAICDVPQGAGGRSHGDRMPRGDFLHWVQENQIPPGFHFGPSCQRRHLTGLDLV